MDSKPELIIVTNNVVGGVASFWKNLVSNDASNFFDKKVIYLDCQPTTETTLSKPFGTCADVIFTYNETDTVYHVSKQLSNSISPTEGAVLTNFDTELRSLHLHRKNEKTIFYFCHDEAYLTAAVKYQFLIDVYVVHNPIFVTLLNQQLNNRAADIVYIPYGVTTYTTYQKQINTNNTLNIVWLARLNKHKGIYDIPPINEALKALHCKVNFTIIGNGPEKEAIVALVKNEPNFTFINPTDNSEVVAILKQQDVFILPSYLDGLPVAMLESMSVGCVPVVSNFNEGIQQVVTSNIGFVLPKGKIEQFAHTISTIDKDRSLLATLSKASKQLVEQEYNVTVQSQKYYTLFAQYKSLKKAKQTKYLNYGISTHPLMPTFLQKTMLQFSTFIHKLLPK